MVRTSQGGRPSPAPVVHPRGPARHGACAGSRSMNRGMIPAVATRTTRTGRSTGAVALQGRFSPAGSRASGLPRHFRAGSRSVRRVYLAEEIRLGGHLVAIKVSRPDGNEPRRSRGSSIRRSSGPLRPLDPSSGLASSACPISAGPTSPRCSRPPAGCSPPSTPAEAWSRPSTGSAAGCRRSQRASRPPRAPAVGARSSVRPGQRRPHRDGPTRPSVRPCRGDRVQPCRSPASSPGSPHRRRVRRRRPPTLRRRPRSTLAPVPRSATAIQAAVWIVARLAEGLDHAHSRGLLHRDLKPSNILLAADGTPMLLDFNLSAETARPNRRRRGRTRHDRRHAPLHGPRTPRRLPPPRRRLAPWRSTSARTSMPWA